MFFQCKSRSLGFSLLELSIVLVIIGLLAGGVMVGQDLVHQAELRSVTSDVNKIASSVNLFRNKYNALPGDMRNAESYWGSAAACPAGARTGTQTCNGTGNSILGLNEQSGVSPEFWEAWRHLANAGLIEGTYTGLSASATVEQPSLGVNVPESKMTGVGYSIHSAPNQAEDSIYFSGDYRLILTIGAVMNSALMRTAAFSPTDMVAVESKLDDGRPGTGIVRAYKYTNCVSDTAVAADKFATTYVLTSQAASCAMIYSIGGNPG